jgi:hypothetical protein
MSLDRNDLDDSLRRAQGYRWILPVIYLLSVAAICVTFFVRSHPAEPTAVRDMLRNEKIQPGDLETDEIRKLTGTYLKSDIRRGDPIAAADVGKTPVKPALENAVVAVISIPRLARDASKIDPGSDVQICLNGNRNLGGLTKVRSVDCDTQQCSIQIALPALPAEGSQPLDLKGAWLAPPTQQSCSSALPQAR